MVLVWEITRKAVVWKMAGADGLELRWLEVELRDSWCLLAMTVDAGAGVM